MSVAFWPTTLPLRPSIRFGGGPVDNRASFQADRGEPIERPLTTGKIETFDATFVGS